MVYYEPTPLGRRIAKLDPMRLVLAGLLAAALLLAIALALAATSSEDGASDATAEAGPTPVEASAGGETTASDAPALFALPALPVKLRQRLPNLACGAGPA